MNFPINAALMFAVVGFFYTYAIPPETPGNPFSFALFTSLIGLIVLDKITRHRIKM